MITFFKKPYRWAAAYSIVLILLSLFVLLDAFVIPRTVTADEYNAQASGTASDDSSDSIKSEDNTGSIISEGATQSQAVTDTSYEDENIKINVETVYDHDTYIYIADIQVADASYLKTAFADNTYGRNIKQSTSGIAADNDALFAINGDFYGFRDSGFVLRNGVLYRDAASEEDALVINSTGEFSIVDESQASASELAGEGAWQILSFGPALIEGGEITVTKSSEVDKAMNSNPRTAIGQVSPLHYIAVVADGRTNESDGLTLLELAQVFLERGCTVAYNLDGGGSSTMWFNGEIINNPTDGHSSGERKVSDIVYIGY